MKWMKFRSLTCGAVSVPIVRTSPPATCHPERRSNRSRRRDTGTAAASIELPRVPQPRQNPGERCFVRRLPVVGTFPAGAGKVSVFRSGVAAGSGRAAGSSLAAGSGRAAGSCRAVDCGGRRVVPAWFRLDGRTSGRHGGRQRHRQRTLHSLRSRTASGHSVILVLLTGVRRRLHAGASRGDATRSNRIAERRHSLLARESRLAGAARTPSPDRSVAPWSDTRLPGQHLRQAKPTRPETAP